MAYSFIGGKFREVDANGLPLAGGLLYTYAAGTLTPLATFTDAGGLSSNTNPVVLDSAGRADVFLGTAAYRMILKTALGVTIWDEDNIVAAQASLASFIASLAGPTGSASVGYQLTATQSAIRLLNLKLSEWVSVTDFKNNDGTAVLGDYNGTTGRDNLTGFQAAINYCQLSSSPGTYATNSPANGSSVLFVPSGNYKLNGTLTITAKIHICGDGPAERASGSRLLQFNNAVDLIQVNPQAAGMSVSMEDITLAGTAGGAGNLFHVTGATGQCNSSRIQRCFFGTPPAVSIKIDRGDDWLIANNTFDASNGDAIACGTSAAANVVSTLRIVNNDFFEIPTHCILFYNVVGWIVSGNHVTRQSVTRTNYFIDAANTLPYQIKDGVVTGNVLNSVDYMLFATAANNLTVTSNDGILMGAGAGAIHSNIELTGTCTNVVVGLNNMSGNWDTKNFYNDAGATVANASISANNVVATGGTGTAIVANGTTGKLGPNNLSGFSRNYSCADYLAAGLPLTESQTLAYSAAISTDASLGSNCTVTATNATPFTISNPTNPSVGELLEYTIRNNSGGALGALTFGALFKIGAAWVQPATSFNRAILFRWNGTNWVEKYRSAADISN